MGAVGRIPALSRTRLGEKVDHIPEIMGMLNEGRRPIDFSESGGLEVIVPIYNAYDDFVKCLHSLLSCQDIYRIILLHDCSTDGRVKEFLQTLKEHEHEGFRLEENPRNLGYLKTANKGMRMTKHDVILLNTDTVVTPGWARKMRACAYSDDTIATVTPFTNNGRMCSVPEFLENNEIPEGFTVDSFAECVQNASSNRYPDLVTAVGFCMYIRRNVIEEIGYFDDVNFEMGYGEEVDFSFRAARRGYRNVLCDNTFVFHKGRASFLDTQDTVMEKHHKVLEEKYPELWLAVALFERSNPLKEFHRKLRREMKLRVFRRIGRWDWAAVKAGIRPPFLRLGRRLYGGLPLSPRARLRLADLSFRLAGPLFEGVTAYDAWKRARDMQPESNPAANPREESQGPRETP